MAVHYAKGKRTASGTTRILIAIIAGVVAWFVADSVFAWYSAPLVAWDTAAGVYLLWMWSTISRLKDKETSDFALREDPSRGLTDFVLLFASIASLAAVATVLLSGSTSTSATAWRAGLGVFSVVLSWALTHTIFMLRYAELYYTDIPGGVAFDGTTQPSFRDFAYLAFTMGMTFQVSDTGFRSTAFRSLALRHALLSYMFGTVIVATTINLVAGLSH
jgi:uncharacterized membrane protein